MDGLPPSEIAGVYQVGQMAARHEKKWFQWHDENTSTSIGKGLW